MVAETAILVTIATSLASGMLKDLSKKAIDAVAKSSTVTDLRSAFFKALEPQLRLLQKELNKLESVLCIAQCIDPTKCHKNNLVLLWLKTVKEAAFFADNLFDEIAYEKTRKQVLGKQSRLRRLVATQHLFGFRNQVARKVNKFMSMTAKIFKEAESTLNLAQLVGKAPIYQPTSTISADLRELRENPDTSIVIGRQADEDLIVSKLCGPTTDHQLPVIAIVGRSGLGKTTLARMIYDNQIVREHFGIRTWIFVSDHFNLNRFLDEMLQSVTGQSHNLSNNSAMEDKLQQCLQEEERGYLLVLDDVWNTDEQLWKSVESSLLRITQSTKSRVLATTQSSDVASRMCAYLAHQLKDLSDADAWELFKKTAFANKTGEQATDLEDAGRRILSKCKGLPLAIRTMGSMLGSMNKKSEWESVERSEIWGLAVGESKIMPWLLLSFHHLPGATTKQCFVHCSVIIEKGTVVRQSKLIQGWMAQGLIDSTEKSGMSMEDTGEVYVRTLFTNGLLQMDNHNDDGCSLWMHDLVHDLASFISKDTRLIAREACELHNAYEVEHLRIGGSGSQMSEYNFPKGKTLSKLRTLICTKATLSLDLASQAKFLRDLRLIKCGMKEVPTSIGRLKHLKYLSLRDNQFSYLPESIGTLFNLQTIDIRQCWQLIELPQAIKLLVSLRHILYDEREFAIYYLSLIRVVKMPEGMGQLTCLRTMPAIHLKGNVGFQIKELRSLSMLCGYLVICGLEHVSCKQDAMEASLIAKAGITNMRLEWSDERQGSHRVSEEEEIMDGLQPHSNLEGIFVHGFGGKRLSSWISDMRNLKKVTLHDCRRCEKLPTLGQLGCLEDIVLWGMHSIEGIGIEFYYNDGDNGERRDNDETRKIILFPRLKTLCLSYMDKLRDWVEPSRPIYDIFPCLEILEIQECPLLIRAPTRFPSLMELQFKAVPSEEAMMMILTKSINLTRLVIGRVEQLTSFSCLLPKCTLLKSLSMHYCKELRELCPTLQCMASLETIELLRCDSLASFPDIEGLSSLRHLSIKECGNLCTIPAGLESCVSLQTLGLEKNAKLDLIPDLRNLTSLTSLRLSGFSRHMSIPEWLSGLSRLRVLEIGALNKELEEFGDIRHLPKCLKELTLVGWPKLKSLPTNLQLLNHLQVLRILKFGELETLPEWLGELSCLQELHIWDCGKLKYLPSQDVMRRLTQLRKFRRTNCPLLTERCRRNVGEEWPKISHLQDF